MKTTNEVVEQAGNATAQTDVSSPAPVVLEVAEKPGITFDQIDALLVKFGLMENLHPTLENLYAFAHAVAASVQAQPYIEGAYLNEYGRVSLTRPGREHLQSDFRGYVYTSPLPAPVVQQPSQLTMTPELRRELQAWGRATEGDQDADDALVEFLNGAIRAPSRNEVLEEAAKLAEDDDHRHEIGRVIATAIRSMKNSGGGNGS